MEVYSGNFYLKVSENKYVLCYNYYSLDSSYPIEVAFSRDRGFFSQLGMSADLRKNAAHTVGWVERVPPKNPAQTIHFKVQGDP